ncbi:MAG: hypothetical protein ACI8ZB_001018 [Desulforhopalus sp.]|jgi:hypothetical protein
MDFFHYLHLNTTSGALGNFQVIAMWLAVLSLITFILSLILIPYLIKKIPSDYFLRLSDEQPRLKGYDVTFVLFFLARNIFGLLLLICGIAMLFLPGQGLLTIFISFLLLSFPGKKRLITYLTHKKVVRLTVDWIRKKAHQKPINWPPEP